MLLNVVFEGSGDGIERFHPIHMGGFPAAVNINPSDGCAADVLLPVLFEDFVAPKAGGVVHLLDKISTPHNQLQSKVSIRAFLTLALVLP